VLLRGSVRLNGIGSLAVTKLDVLCGLKQLKVCTAYELDGQTLTSVPPEAEDLARCRPVYEDLPGWEEEINSARRLSELPREARGYLTRIEELCGVKISLISVGPARDQTILLEDVFAKPRQKGKKP
jgi:adenylosuccinate synthase